MLSRGTAAIKRVSRGVIPVKKISIGTALIWSDAKELYEPWSTLDTSIWRQTKDPGTSGSFQDVSGGYLRAGGTSSWNARLWGNTYTRTQFLTPAARWEIKMGGGSLNTLWTRIIVSTDSAASRMVMLEFNSNTVELNWRTSASASKNTIAKRSYSIPNNATVVVERDAGSNYTVRVNDAVVLQTSDSNRRAEAADMGFIGVGQLSDRNVFNSQGFSNPVDYFDYTDDV